MASGRDSTSARPSTKSHCSKKLFVSRQACAHGSRRRLRTLYAVAARDDRPTLPVHIDEHGALLNPPTRAAGGQHGAMVIAHEVACPFQIHGEECTSMRRPFGCGCCRCLRSGTRRDAGAPPPCGDGGPARQAELNHPADVVPTRKGGFLIADFFNNRIRKVNGGSSGFTPLTQAFHGDRGRSRRSCSGVDPGQDPLPHAWATRPELFSFWRRAPRTPTDSRHSTGEVECRC